MKKSLFNTQLSVGMAAVLLCLSCCTGQPTQTDGTTVEETAVGTTEEVAEQTDPTTSEMGTEPETYAENTAEPKTEYPKYSLLYNNSDGKDCYAVTDLGGSQSRISIIEKGGDPVDGTFYDVINTRENTPLYPNDPDKLSDFQYFIMRGADGKYGIMSKDGEVLLEPVYYDISSPSAFYLHLFVVRAQPDQAGIVDVSPGKKFTWLVPAGTYSQIFSYSTETPEACVWVFIARRIDNNKLCILSNTDCSECSDGYDRIILQSNGLFCALDTDNEKYVYLDWCGNGRGNVPSDIVSGYLHN